MPGQTPSRARLNIICGAICASAVVVCVLARFVTIPTQNLSVEYVRIIGGIGFLNIVLSHVLPRMLVLRTPGAPAQGYPAAATIVAFALKESAVLLGFVIAGISANLEWLNWLALTAFVSMAVDWPTERRIARLEALISK